MGIQNVKTYSQYGKLINVGLDVFGAKTDAFTIRQTYIDWAQTAIDVYDGSGIPTYRKHDDP